MGMKTSKISGRSDGSHSVGKGLGDLRLQPMYEAPCLPTERPVLWPGDIVGHAALERRVEQRDQRAVMDLVAQ